MYAQLCFLLLPEIDASVILHNTGITSPNLEINYGNIQLATATISLSRYQCQTTDDVKNDI